VPVLQLTPYIFAHNMLRRDSILDLFISRSLLVINNLVFYRAKILDRYDIFTPTMRIYPPASLPRMPRVNAITSRATVSVIPNMII